MRDAGQARRLDRDVDAGVEPADIEAANLLAEGRHDVVELNLSLPVEELGVGLLSGLLGRMGVVHRHADHLDTGTHGPHARHHDGFPLVAVLTVVVQHVMDSRHGPEHDTEPEVERGSEELGHDLVALDLSFLLPRRVGAERLACRDHKACTAVHDGLGRGFDEPNEVDLLRLHPDDDAIGTGYGRRDTHRLTAASTHGAAVRFGQEGDPQLDGLEQPRGVRAAIRGDHGVAALTRLLERLERQQGSHILGVGVAGGGRDDLTGLAGHDVPFLSIEGSRLWRQK